jgi:O-acetyl-ADP-ribose deacetylase
MGWTSSTGKKITPMQGGGRRGEPELLAGCYRRCLELAGERGIRTISFPAISTGIYGYPQDAAAGIAIREARAHLEDAATSVEQVIFVLFGQDAEEIYRGLL